MAPKPILTLLAAILPCLAAWAQHNPCTDVYRADSTASIHKLGKAACMFIDSSGGLSFSQVSVTAINSGFKPIDHDSVEIKPGHAYWLRFTLTSGTGMQNWWLVLASREREYFAGNAYVDVYQLSPRQKLKHSRAGLFVPRSERAISNMPSINRVPFSIAAGDTQQLYVRVQNPKHDEAKTLAIPELRDPAISFPEAKGARMFIIASSITFILGLLSLFFFFFVQDKAYLFFCGYVFFLCLHYQVLNPEMPLINLLVPEHPHVIVHIWRVLTMGSFIFFFLFGRSFIALHKLNKRTDVFLKWFLSIWVLIVLIDLIGLAVSQSGFINAAFFFLIFIAALGFIIRLAFIKNTLARIFVAGALWLVIFTILGGLWNSGIINLPVNPWLTGQYGQLFIYCFGLAYKVRLNERARAEADHIKGLDEIKSRFFANISHEFRTPLTLIRGPLQQIEEEAAGNREGMVSVPWRRIKSMRKHTDRLLELVNQLLDLSRLDSGKMKLQVARGDVIQFLKSLTAAFESMAERKQIHYHMHFPEGVQLAFFDRDKLEKIVTNLLGNAFKYTPEKGTVSLIAEADEKRLRLSVEDSGPGIPKKELDKVFDRFYQAEGNEDKGTGIGLALVKELADLYRGQISVSSEPGKGSRFRISLPLDHAAFREDEFIDGHESPEASASIMQTSYGEESYVTAAAKDGTELPLLLVVEDNTDLRMLICEIVAPYYQVMQAVNGKEGFDKAVQEVPDIIVSDVMMPVMDGFALAEKLKKDERTSHIPIILLTAKAGQTHKVEGLETGADDYLTKPFDHKELLVRLHNLLNQRKLLRRKFAGEIILKPSEVSVNSADDNFLGKVMQAIEDNMGEEEFGVEELAKKVALSRSQLHRKLVALTGQSPSEVLRNARLLRAKELLQKKAATPSEVAFQVGFNSHTYFSRCFREEFGISPSEV